MAQLPIEEIVQSCFELYSNLHRSGKPIEDEWTVLSCVVQYDTSNDEHTVVSLGTGSKCIGATKMSPRGEILNDSHAEIFARRGFLLYLYDNIEKAIEKQPSIFNYDEKKFKLKDNIEFVFYSSQLPCGDASITPKSDYSEFDEQCGDILQPQKHKLEDSSAIPHKKSKLLDDIHRTGAKCLPSLEQDPKTPGIDYHLVGQVRTKPGRGDRTLSLSCSDKIAKWIHLGIQGGLISIICEPIYMKYFIFGGGVPYSEESLNRAFLSRNSDGPLKPSLIPNIVQSKLAFECIKSEKKVRPAAGSIVWVKMKNPVYEVAIQGRKLGLTKKRASLLSSALCISKYKIYKTFIHMLRKSEELKHQVCGKEDLGSIPYKKMKLKATNYYNLWENVLSMFFKSWTVKPDMWHFCIEE